MIRVRVRRVAAVAACALLACVPASASGSPAAKVKVTVSGRSCTLSTRVVPVGPVTFVISNRSASVDSFVVAGTHTRTLRPGRTGTITVEFQSAGSYPYRCTTGVRGRITVKSVGPQALTLTQLASGLGPLTDVAVAPGDPDRLFVLEQSGRVLMLDDGAQTVVADLSAMVRSDGENGLLGMAFSPAFAQDRTVYLDFINRNGSGGDEVASATMNADWTIDLSSLHVVLDLPTPGANHRGGDIAFGPDGLLYVPLGDGDNGTYTVIGQYAQDPSSMLGGIVRVDPTTGAVTQWAKGLRNPWRDYLDAATGTYYIGDVGENDREEIDAVPLSGGPYNFGWPCVEGTEVHTDTTVQCPPASELTAPVLDYPHEGRCAVIAGVVVHDPRLTSLDGSFVYSDLCDGELRAFTYAGGQATDERVLGLQVDSPTSFGEGPDGRVYLVTNGGSLYRLDPAG